MSKVRDSEDWHLNWHCKLVHVKCSVRDKRQMAVLRS